MALRCGILMKRTPKRFCSHYRRQNVRDSTILLQVTSSKQSPKLRMKEVRRSRNRLRLLF